MPGTIRLLPGADIPRNQYRRNFEAGSLLDLAKHARTGHEISG
jgi:hypothetical protein